MTVDAAGSHAQHQQARTVLDLSADVGRGGHNLPADVVALKRRLTELGFAWLGSSDQMDDATVQAIQLFQGIKNGHGAVLDHTVNDGLVEVGRDTHRWLQARNAPRWQSMPAGFPEAGFYNAELVDTADRYDFGTEWLASTVVAAGAEYRQTYLDAHPSAALLTLNDTALPRGVPQPDERVDHVGHQTGLEVDLRLPRTDGGAGDIAYTDTTYDQFAMRAQLRALHSQPLVRSVLFNDPLLVDEGLCTAFENHDDHVHVRIQPPARGDVAQPRPRRRAALHR